jgi:negative regulator of flagellin synthesis FlgM
MKVEGRRPPETLEVQLRAQKPGKRETTPGVSENPQSINKSDQVHISEKSKDIEELMQVIHQMPEIRADKVEALKKAIQEGRYQVDSLKVAGKILEEI